MEHSMSMITIIQVIIFVLIAYLIIRYVFQITVGAPYEPTLKRKLDKLVNLADVKPGDKVIDVGSGDGRIVIAFAEKGAEAHGIEINPWLILYSRWKIKKAGLNNKAFIHWKNFWKMDLSSYDIIILFQIKNIMDKLQHKLESELKNNVKIISHVWQFPLWEHKSENDKIFLYIKS